METVKLNITLLKKCKNCVSLREMLKKQVKSFTAVKDLKPSKLQNCILWKLPLSVRFTNYAKTVISLPHVILYISQKALGYLWVYVSVYTHSHTLNVACDLV